MVWAQVYEYFRYAGIPIFSALYIDNQERSVSLLQAKDYAKSQGEQDLLRRIDEYERSVSERLESEATAAGNFILIILILVLSYQLNAPNFLMKISEFADPFLQGYAYKVVAFLLVAQGLVGRMTSFYLLGASGSLPPDFFRSEEERLNAENWNVEILRRYEPLVERWKHKIK